MIQAIDPTPGLIEAIEFGREVCARRARKLRKRGESLRFCGLTVNGKSRYVWISAKEAGNG